MPVGRCNVEGSERADEQRGLKKHPFVHGDGIVAAHEGIEEAQI
jgi:hypothetical protein